MGTTTRLHPVPSFAKLVGHYPNLKSPGAVKRMIGGALDDTKPGSNHWLGGEDGNTCTIRISRDLNYSGVPIPTHFHGLNTAIGADGLNYAYRVQEMRHFLNSYFGPPDLELKGKPVDRARFAGLKGIIAFNIHFSDATGHLDLWDGHTFFDEIYGMSHAGHDFFQMADLVSLWIADGDSALQPPPDA